MRGVVAGVAAVWAALALMLAATVGAAGMPAPVGGEAASSRGGAPGRVHLLARDGAAEAPAGVARPGNNPPGPFPFQTATSPDGLIAVHYYQQAATFGANVVSAARTALAHPIADTLGFTLKRRVDIYVYNTRDDFLAGAPVVNAEETGALTSCDTPACDVYIEVGSDNPSALSDDLPHELTHAVFHQNEDTASIQQYFTFFPLWLDEGLATHDETYDSYSSTVTDAAKRGTLLDILHDFATDYPSNPDTDFLAYAEAHGFIGYLYDTYGRDAMHAFLADARDGNLDFAAERRFGAGLRVLEGRWEASLGAAPRGVNLGYVPRPVGGLAPKPGALPPVTSTTRPFAVDAGEPVPAAWLVGVLGLLVAALLLVVNTWRERATRPGAKPEGVLLAYSAGDALARAPAPEVAVVAGDGKPAAAVPAGPTHPYEPEEVAAHEERPCAAASAAASEAAPSGADGGAGGVVLAFPGGATARKVTRAVPRWYDAALPALALPVSVGAGLVVATADPLHEWRRAFLVTAAVALLCLLGALEAARRGWGRERLPAFRALTLAGLALLVGASALLAGPAGQQQAQAYEARGAYALALRYYADAGLPDDRRDLALARIHRRWAEDAAGVDDYATAVAQMRQAVALDDPYAAPGDRTALIGYVKDWGQAYLAQGQFDAALRTYGDQAASPSCDAACRSAMREQQAGTYLAWGDALLRGGHPDDARAKYQVVTVGYAGTTAAATARRADRETAAQEALAAALAAGDRGDVGGMNAQLQALARQYAGTVAADEAPGTPEPVRGVVVDGSGASVAGDRLFLLGFSSESAARSFDYQFHPDGSVVKVATTLSAGGSFAVRLPPDLWYVACWDDPSQAQYESFNAPSATGNDAFYVAPLAPGDAGVIVGY